MTRFDLCLLLYILNCEQLFEELQRKKETRIDSHEDGTGYVFGLLHKLLRSAEVRGDGSKCDYSTDRAGR